MQPNPGSFLVNYQNIKKKREEFLKKRFSGRKNTKRKTPWYMLTSGKQYNYEEHQESWGTRTDFFRVDSEMKELAKKNSILRGVRGECKLELYTKHKLNKWIKRNPKPCDDRDLFANQYLPEWENCKKEAETRIKNHLMFLYENKFIFNEDFARILKRITMPNTIKNKLYLIYDWEYENIDFMKFGGNFLCDIKTGDIVSKEELKPILVRILNATRKWHKYVTEVGFTQDGILILLNSEDISKIKERFTKIYNKPKNNCEHYGNLWNNSKTKKHIEFKFHNSTAKVELLKYNDWTKQYYWTTYYYFDNNSHNLQTQLFRNYTENSLVSTQEIIENILKEAIRQQKRIGNNDIAGARFVQKNISIEI